MNLAEQQRQAMLAATAAVSAGNALIAFHKDGPEGRRAFVLEDPIGELAEALARALDIEDCYLSVLPGEPVRAEKEASDQLRAAIRKWQSGAGETNFLFNLASKGEPNG